MKTRILVLFVSTLFVSHANANTTVASEVWNYRVEPAGLIKGGKVKISEMERGRGSKKIRFKYKLDTSAGFKEAWIPYNLPESMFDPDFLSKMEVGSTADLGALPNAVDGTQERFRITRNSPASFTVTSNDGSFTIFPRNEGGAWNRIEFKIQGGLVVLRIHGDLEAITAD